MAVLTLNILGAGKVGRVLGRLWCEGRQFQVQQVLNNDLASAAAATGFMGQGEPVRDWTALRPADAWMIGSNDAAIPGLAARLAESGLVASGQLVFHLSGALSADVFQVLQQSGAVAASLHPLKSFPDPVGGYHTFGQTFCALEGDESACQVLERALRRIAGRPFYLDSEQKMLYHAANTLLCNHLLGLLDAGLGCYEQAGIETAQALEMVAPLMRETLANGLSLGPEKALTGPLVRGDSAVVRAHLDKLPDFARDIYCALGIQVLQLAVKSGRLTSAQRREFKKIFDRVDIALE